MLAAQAINGIYESLTKVTGTPVGTCAVMMNFDTVPLIEVCVVLQWVPLISPWSRMMSRTCTVSSTQPSHR